jgi:hypothetical protein
VDSDKVEGNKNVLLNAKQALFYRLFTTRRCVINNPEEDPLALICLAITCAVITGNGYLRAS